MAKMIWGIIVLSCTGCFGAIGPEDDKASRAPRAVVVAIDDDFLADSGVSATDRGAFRNAYGRLQHRMNRAARENQAQQCER